MPDTHTTTKPPEGGETFAALGAEKGNAPMAGALLRDRFLKGLTAGRSIHPVNGGCNKNHKVPSPVGQSPVNQRLESIEIAGNGVPILSSGLEPGTPRTVIAASGSPLGLTAEQGLMRGHARKSGQRDA